VLPGKVSKFPITSVLCVFPDSVAISVSGVLRDRRQSESKSVSKILPRVRWVLMTITSPLFIGFEGMSNGWKVANVSYELGIGSFLRLCLDWTQG
jgi:hypothetical protein